MREIRFRAWHKDYKFMEEVDMNYWYNFNNNVYILMQYTGLKDKNGKEIYEGDIVEYVAGETYANTGVVTWVNERNSSNLKTYPFMCGFVIHNEKENKTDKFEWDETNYMEVIGNIYENPELLGEKSA